MTGRPKHRNEIDCNPIPNFISQMKKAVTLLRILQLEQIRVSRLTNLLFRWDRETPYLNREPRSWAELDTEDRQSRQFEGAQIHEAQFKLVGQMGQQLWACYCGQL